MDARQLWDSDPMFQEIARSLGVQSADEADGIVSGCWYRRTTGSGGCARRGGGRAGRRRKLLVPIRKGAGLVARKALPYHSEVVDVRRGDDVRAGVAEPVAEAGAGHGCTEHAHQAAPVPARTSSPRSSAKLKGTFWRTSSRC